MHPLPEQKGECSFMERSGFIRQHTLWPHGECVTVLTQGICAGTISKRKRAPDNPQALCQTHSPVSHWTGHFHPWNCFWDEGGITSATVQGLNGAKPSQGHRHRVTALLGTGHHLGKGASSSHPFHPKHCSCCSACPRACAAPLPELTRAAQQYSLSGYDRVLFRQQSPFLCPLQEAGVRAIPSESF